MRHHVLAGGLAILLMGCATSNDYESAPHVQIETLVAGTPLNGIQGLTWGNDGYLYAAAVAAQTVSRVDPETGAVELLIDAPDGESDDVDLGPDGTLVWTAMISGELRGQRPGQSIEVLARDVPWLNPVAFDPTGRLFGVTMGNPSRLWEFYLDDQRLPRLVTDEIGPLNAFDFAADGTLYGPYWQGGQLVKVNVDTGVITVLAEGLGSPTAVQLDSQGRLISVDYGTGEVRRTDPATGVSSIIATVEPPLDNLAVGPDDTIYVSEAARSGILAMRPDGTGQRRITGGEFATPGGIDVGMVGGKETLVVADTTGYRFVDPIDGTVTRLPYEFGVGSSTDVALAHGLVAATNSRGGGLQVFNAVTHEMLADVRDLAAPYGIDDLPDGSFLFVEHGRGTVVRWTPDATQTIASGLDSPVGLALASDSVALVSENESGDIVRVDLANGSTSVVFKGLKRPEGLAMMADGRLAVVEVGTGRLLALDLERSEREVLVAGLDLGVAAIRAPVTVGFPSGVTVGRDGALYVSEDDRNAILKVTLN